MTDRDEIGTRHKIVERFINIVDDEEVRDAGIVGFDQKLIELQDLLTQQHAGKGIESFADFHAAEDDLTERWLNNQEFATVTGRVYIRDAAFVDLVPETWGEPEVTETGELYYFIEDARLFSHGVTVDPVILISDEISKVKVGYLFSFQPDENDIEGEREVLVAYPGELAKHLYEIPSPEEAELRLSQKWPKQFKAVQHLLKTGSEIPLQQQLALIEAKVQDELRSSEKFRAYLEIYFADRMSFHEEYPYIITADSEVVCFDGQGNPYDEPGQFEGAWTKVTLKDSLTVMGYEPIVRLFEDVNGSVRIDITVIVYNAENGDDPEYVRFNAGDVTQLRSTRAQRAILDRVFSSYGVEENSDLSSDLLAETEDQTIEGVVSLEKYTPPGGEIPEELREMALLHREIAKANELVVEAQKTLYETEEEALKASITLLSELKNIVIGAGILNGYEFSFSGVRILIPNTLPDNEISVKADASALFVSAVGAEHPFLPMQNGDVISGVIEVLTANVARVPTDDDDEPIRYRAAPCAVVNISKKNEVLLTVQGIPLVEANVVVRMLVPFGGEAEMRIKSLDRYEEIVELISQSSKEYGRHEIVQDFRDLSKELLKEKTSGYVDLEDVTLLTGIDSHIRNIEVQRMRRIVALETLSALLDDRAVYVVGDIFSHDGSVHPPEDESTGHIRGRVVDIDEGGDDGGLRLYIAISESKVVYVPLASIKVFRF